MPDRSLRLPPLLLRERRPSPVPPHGDEQAPQSGGDSANGGSAGGGRGSQPPSDDNPFAPPPEGTPDRPWQPRRPAPGQGQPGRGSGDRGPAPWGGQWSDRQPGPAAGGRFGERPGTGGGGQGGPEGSGGPGAGMRWDPTDPAQRRARYALLSGMWAVFFALFSWTYLALLLGALALYWGTSALRAKPRDAGPGTSTAGTPAERPRTATARPQTTAAVSGLVTASLAIVMVAITFTAQLVYRDYYTCVNDALTSQAKQSCADLLPKDLRGVLGSEG
ncbi:hypothetical protein [Streptomyces nodosus]|nr:hypothetical protein [Streptomyces nodosus]